MCGLALPNSDIIHEANLLEAQKRFIDLRFTFVPLPSCNGDIALVTVLSHSISVQGPGIPSDTIISS